MVTDTRKRNIHRLKDSLPMGIFPVLESRQDFSSSTPSLPPLPKAARLSEVSSWKQVGPISPPMSHYDPVPLMEMDDRKDTNHAGGVVTSAPPRQQLPSLSSLFGLPQMRPLHSPLSDSKLSPLSVPSPLDRPPTSGTLAERSLSGSSSYFPSNIPPLSLPSVATQPRSMYDQHTRYSSDQPLNPFSRPISGPVSPRSKDIEQPRKEAESRWSIHQDSSRHEYALGSREASSHLSVSGSRLGDHEMIYREAAPRHPLPVSTSSIPNQIPSTPISVAEGAPAKDGLGPRIWTGTHFLPRFVRAAEVPGEGLCYFYDDGSHCKTVIDGEAVNAHWGVTKAGKPRKRLAIACVTCREKKIKCDPDYPRCLQCEKFGRVCKFKNAPRGGHNNSPGNSPGEHEESRRAMLSGPLGGMPGPAPLIGSGVISKTNDHRRPESQSSVSLSPRTHMMRPGSSDGPIAKRPRLVYDTTNNNYTPMPGEISAAAGTPESTKSSLSWRQTELPRLHEDVLMRAWQTDPYVNDPQSVITILSSFFARVECTALRFLPEKPLTLWVQNNAHRKSSEDLMLVYSILALGIALSPSSDRLVVRSSHSTSDRSLAFDYSQIARYATERTKLCMQLVQARLILSIYYLTVSRPCDSNDMLSAAISTAACLQMNLELDSSCEAKLTNFPYGLNRKTYEEMRRRTFWSCFVLERINGLFPYRVGIINADDIFLQLPIAWNRFQLLTETSSIDKSPYFKTDHICTEENVDPFLRLVEVTTIWGQIMTTLYRIAHQPVDFEFNYIIFYDKMMNKLSDWKSTLPPQYKISSALLIEQVDKEGELGTVMTMNLLYYLSVLKLNRHIHSRFLQGNRARYVRNAEEAARTILDVMAMLGVFAGQWPEVSLAPLSSYALVESVDVITAKGLLKDLNSCLHRIAAARHVLSLLRNTWEETVLQDQVILNRTSLLCRIQDRARFSPASPVEGCRIQVARDHTSNSENTAVFPEGALFWQVLEPLESRFPAQMDLIYNRLE